MEARPSLDTLCAALADAMGASAPACAAPADTRLTDYVNSSLSGRKADRLFLFNPDAVAQWVWEKYPTLRTKAEQYTELSLPYRTVMPSVTPVCFGTFYTGAQPCVHGIESYAKPIITIDTLFDALIRAGKKVALIAQKDSSLSLIFGGRKMDYFIHPTLEEGCAKAAELIVQDCCDVIVLYDAEFDDIMHVYGPESPEALAALHANSEVFAMLVRLIREKWKSHDTLVGFAMDHGCHEKPDGRGTHGKDLPEDLEILHRYVCIPRETESAAL